MRRDELRKCALTGPKVGIFRTSLKHTSLLHLEARLACLTVYRFTRFSDHGREFSDHGHEFSDQGRTLVHED